MIDKKIIIEFTAPHNVNITTNVHGQELYEAYVALTAQIALELTDKSELITLCANAARDAMRMSPDRIDDCPSMLN